jgi:Stage II sporulation protein E (SpoIIE)
VVLAGTEGVAAAMTAALLVGGAEDHADDSPGRMLSHLDHVLRESRVGGFSTCLCADVCLDGQITLANAGHLPPYLGALLDTGYSECTENSSVLGFIVHY